MYLGTIASGVVLLAASVVKSLYFRPGITLDGPALDAQRPDPADLLRCNRDVAALLADLSRTAISLVSEPSAGDEPREIQPAWDRFSQRWLRSWEEVNALCRFDELSGSHMGDAYDRMARVHADLLAMRLKYHSLLVRFADEQADELASMRRALQRSHREIEATARGREEQAQ